jgi:hypothetical protein
MKKLILLSLLVSPTLYANEIMDGSEGRQIVSQIKDIQVTDMLQKTGEFSDCRQKYPYKETDSETIRTQNLNAAEKCFRDKLAKETNKDKLKELSESLNLQQYGLVQSQNLKDIQNYLADKMYESMTGVNRKEADKKKLIDSMKFGKKKNIDQKTFVEMYKTQLGKNALYEVSRFCFEKLRVNNHPEEKNGPTNFADYWRNYIDSVKPDQTANVNDSGEPKFGNYSDPSDKTKIYQDIFTGIQGSDPSKAIDPEKMGAFFLTCGKLITKLCEGFSSSQKIQNEIAEGGASSKTDKNSVTPGGAACLAKTRIQEYRLALQNAEKMEDYFAKEMASSPQSLSIALSGQPIKIYGQGGDNEPSIDDLTNNTASSFIEGNYNKDQAALDKLDECAKSPELSKCEGVVSVGDSLGKAKHNIELEMTLKRDVEMARVRELVAGDRKDLRQYLEDGGYFDILKKIDDKTIQDGDIEKLIGQTFEAKKEATLAEINKKLGSRQAKDEATLKNKTDLGDVVKETKEERARLAQVVLFNNIITSSLTLKKKDASGNLSDAGRNVNAWKKEEQELQGKVNASYFENIKKTTDGAQGIGRDSKIAGFEILDELLGKK